MRLVVRLVGVAEPLERRHADGAVERAGSEAQALAEVAEDEVAFDFSLSSDIYDAGLKDL